MKKEHDCIKERCGEEAIPERCPKFDLHVHRWQMKIWHDQETIALPEPTEADELPPPWNDPWRDIGGEG